MERRGFLRGLVLGAGAVAGTALVKLPSAEEVERFTRTPEVALGPLPHIYGPESFQGIFGPVYVEDGKGNFLPIGYIRHVNISCAIDEVIQWEGTIHYVPGLKRGEVKFGGPW